MRWYRSLAAGALGLLMAASVSAKSNRNIGMLKFNLKRIASGLCELYGPRIAKFPERSIAVDLELKPILDIEENLEGLCGDYNPKKGVVIEAIVRERRSGHYQRLTAIDCMGNGDMGVNFGAAYLRMDQGNVKEVFRRQNRFIHHYLRRLRRVPRITYKPK
ncbi:MAG: hypothetical protein ACE5FT_02615 [Candidatus Nanoarchaeia archaeon]